MRRLGAAAIVVAGSAALLARPWFAGLPFDEVTVLVVLFVLLGIVGATWPLPPESSPEAQPPDPQPLAALTAGRGPRAAGSGAASPDAGDGAGRTTGIAESVWIARRDVNSADRVRITSLATHQSGGTWPPRQNGGGPLPAWLVLGVGVGAFGVGRLLAVGTLPAAPLVFRSLVLNSLAAVSEEAFFRRLAYGVADVRGPALAIGTSAALFAAVHVTVWGWAVLPLDLAAGLVLGWQRWASGGWSVPAGTHVVANVLAVV